MPVQIDENLIIYALIALIVVLVIWLVRLEIKIKKLLVGKSGNLDESISSINKELHNLRTFRNEMIKFGTVVDKKLRRSVQGVRTVRFNPFQGSGSGGNQSFSTAIIDEEGNGVVFSSIYSRDRVNVYAKPLSGHGSEHELTGEEKEVIQRAKESIHK